MASKFYERYQNGKFRFFGGGYNEMMDKWFDRDAPSVPNDPMVVGVSLKLTF